MNLLPSLFRWASQARAASRALRFAPLAAACLLAGCVSPGAVREKPSAKAENVYRALPELPHNVQRLAMLPLTSIAGGLALGDGRESLEPVLRSELIATKKFEVFQPAADILRLRTGQSSWANEEALPADFFAKLRDATGCDAVLFSELTVFRPYAPLSIGWRFRLVDVRTAQILWSADEVFEGSQSAVSAGSGPLSWLAPPGAGGGMKDAWAMANSPALFGRSTLETVLATLPER